MDPSTPEQQPSASSDRTYLLLLVLGLVACFAVAGVGAAALIVARTVPMLLAPTAVGTPTLPNLPDTEGENITMAWQSMSTGQWDHAIPYLDRAIQLAPQDGNAYYYRATCYYNLAAQDHIQTDFFAHTAQGRQDIDNAITYGITDPNVKRGDPYYLRYEIYAQTQVESNAARVAFQPVVRENLRTAEALGTSNKYINQRIPFTYFDGGQCAQGMDEIERIRAAYGLSAPPNSSMYNLEANGYLCLGQYDKALEYVDKGLSIQSLPERLYLRALILHYLGRDHEALSTMDSLIKDQPNYNGYRYYFRALLNYQLGRNQEAQADLDTGARNTWGREGLAAYVRGRMEADRGDKASAIRDLKSAYLTLNWQYAPLRASAAKELLALGQQLPSEVATLPFQVTPMPPAPMISVPVYPVGRNGLQIPPNPTPALTDRGTGELAIEGENAYPVINFRPPKPTSIQQVQSLTIHLLPAAEGVSDQFEVFVWQPETGEWTMYKPGWHDIEVENPSQYVDPAGNVYIAVRTDSGTDTYFKQLWVTIKATQADGSPLTLDLSQQP